MQERYRDDPWALLAGCILFNMVHGSKAQPVHEEFLKMWPTPEILWEEYADPATMTPVVLALPVIFKPLGFQNRRASRILQMTEDFLELRPDIPHVGLDVEIRELRGCGKYAADSFDMFYRGYLVEDATDKELKRYVEWAKSLPEGTGEGVRSTPQTSGPAGT